MALCVTECWKPLRQFASIQLNASAERLRYRQIHARYFLDYLNAITGRIEGSEQQHLLQLLEDDLENIRAALDWCAESDDPAPGLRTAWTLTVLAWQRGHLAEMDARLTKLLELPSMAEVSQELRARALLGVGFLAFNRGELQRAHAVLEDALNVFRAYALPLETGQALVWLGLVVDGESDVSRAREYFEEGLALFRDRGDAFWTARATTNLGRCLTLLGEHHRAIPLLEEALTLRRQLGDRRGVANTLHHPADAFEATGDFSVATDRYEQALEITRIVGDCFVTLRALIGLARLAYRRGDLNSAAVRVGEALVAARRDDFGHELAESCLLQSVITRGLGDRAQARELARRLATRTESSAPLRYRLSSVHPWRACLRRRPTVASEDAFGRQRLRVPDIETPCRHRAGIACARTCSWR